jgi:hypothetical protein
MDKTVPQLDPKLKEAYDRVMGTVVTPPQRPPEPTHQEPVTAPPAQPQAMAIPQPATTIEHTPTPAPAAHTEKKKGKVSPLIIALGLIVFLLIYTLVWIKYFGVPVPFLNP